MFLTLLLWLFGLIYVFACVFLILVILMQEGKTGGMSAMGGPSSAPGALMDSFGATGAQKTMFRWTVTSATIFFVLCLGLTLLGNIRSREATGLLLDEEAPAQIETPAQQVPDTSQQQELPTRAENEPVTVPVEPVDVGEPVPMEPNQNGE